MALAYINLSVKQYFNFMCKTDFERRIYHDTYQEFQKKSGVYNSGGILDTFSKMQVEHSEANKLHHELHLSVVKTIQKLDKKIPILNDLRGNSIFFDQAELQIFESDLSNKAAHVVSISYTSPRMVLHEIVNDLLVLSYHIKGRFNNTFMVKMSDELTLNYEYMTKMVHS